MKSSPTNTKISFFGRITEIHYLEQALDLTMSSQGKWVSLTGEPGIGKTQTVQEFSDRARDKGVTVLWGRCIEDEGAPAYWPWIQIFENYDRFGGSATISKFINEGGFDFVRLAPSFIRYVRQHPPDTSLNDRISRFQLLKCVADLLWLVTNQAPTVLVFDDIQWSDPSSLFIIKSIGSELSDRRLMLITTHRGTEVQSSKGFDLFLGESTRYRKCIQMIGLDNSDATKMVASYLGKSPTSQIMSFVMRATGGNPFYLRELAASLNYNGLDGLNGSVDSSTFEVPLQIKDFVRYRLSRLPNDMIELLSVCAVIGLEIDLKILNQFHDLQKSLHTCLDNLVRMGFLSIGKDHIDTMNFSHALVKEAIYKQIPDNQKIDIHLRVATILEEMYTKYPEPKYNQIAYHYERSGKIELAVSYWIRSAEYAASIPAYEDAATMYEQALTGLESLAMDPLQYFELLLKIGDTHGRGGDPVRARQILEKAIQQTRSVNAHHISAKAVLLLGDILDETGAIDITFIGNIENALADLDESDSSMRARLMARLARALYFSKSRERAQALCQKALDLVKKSKDPQTMAEVLYAQHFSLWVPGLAGERLEIAEKIIKIGINSHKTVQAHAWKLLDLLELGNIDGFNQVFEQFGVLTEQSALPRFKWQYYLIQTMQAILHGYLDQAEELAAFAVGQKKGGGLTNAEAFYAVQLYAIRREQGRLNEMESIFRRFVQHHDAIPAWRCGYAIILIETGRIDNARIVFNTLKASDFEDIPKDSNWLLAMAILAELCSLFGEKYSAKIIYEKALPYEDNIIVFGNTALCYGSMALYLGLLASTLYLEKTDEHFKKALKVHNQLGARVLLAHTQKAYADHLCMTSTNPPKLARDLYQQSRITARDLGLVQLNKKLNPNHNQSVQASTDNEQVQGQMIKTGDFWIISLDNRKTTIKDTKGAKYLAEILRNLGKDIHVLKIIETCDQKQLDNETEIDLLDPKARTQYKNRICHLDKEIQEAQSNNDLGRLENAKNEKIFIQEELTRSLTLGGRSRKFTNTVERARLNVSRAVRAVIRNIQIMDPALGHHLETHIRTGRYCRYIRDPKHPIKWRF